MLNNIHKNKSVSKNLYLHMYEAGIKVIQQNNKDNMTIMTKQYVNEKISKIVYS